MRQINKIIIHHSDSDNPNHDHIDVINMWHTDRGFRCVGYHYFIQSNGTIQHGRSIHEMGAHCHGHNRDSIGICLHGKDNFTDMQFESLRLLVEHLKFMSERELTVHGHCEFSEKTCPNFDYKSVLCK